MPSHKVSGVVTLAAAGVARRVRAYRADTGALLAEGLSSAVDGSYELQFDYAAAVAVLQDRDYGKPWQADIVYGLDALALPINPNGHWYKATALAGGGGATTWNPADKHANITLLDNDLTAKQGVGGTWVSVRGTLGHDAADPGGFYFQLDLVAVSSGFRTIIGIGKAGASLNTFVGGDASGWGYAWDARKFTNGSPSSYGVAYANPDRLGVLIKNGKLYFRRNGTWLNGANPDAETGFAYSGITGTVFPMVSFFDVNAQLGAVFDGSFGDALPAGVSEWDAMNKSGSTEPTWPTDSGSVVDGDITWTDQGQMDRPLAHGPIIPVAV